jgi:hypothetical protein
VRQFDKLLRHLRHMQLASDPGRIDAVVYCVCPPEAPADWVADDYLESLRQSLSAEVCLDQKGLQARAWGANTSGYLIVTDPHGQVRFRGGLTRGRSQTEAGPAYDWIIEMISAHEPKNSASSAATATPPLPLTAPVFGCPLWTPN